jgi:hypothetical protein
MSKRRKYSFNRFNSDNKRLVIISSINELVRAKRMNSSDLVRLMFEYVSTDELEIIRNKILFKELIDKSSTEG